ncbi:hypothetical protein [Chelativorans sp. AA-79]|uniref:hypothetical protein n=1 Tax=Chelativorans sp. AA-79 TaxID=3028735 RepID=UPI0023F6985B|nr:hypothetical protein [Chelativorans sp. AA-79]WEX10226.1 hypothetical protein PVE73_04505 [Chelativorans sp. AA-79]
MSRSKRQHPLPEQTAEALPPDLRLLLDEIEKEAVPEKLLVLAMKLQTALAEKRRSEEAAQGARAKTRTGAGNWVKQP